MQITVEVSEELGQQLQQFQDRLQEIVERGLQELLSEQSGNFLDEKQIIGLLASQPTRPDGSSSASTIKPNAVSPEAFSSVEITSASINWSLP